ncbi:MAG: ParB/RepB/Spo0J family partition protein [bacterium]
MKEIPLSGIKPNPDQPRRIFRDDELDELASSISEHGVLQPILVRSRDNGTWEIVTGERRLRAAERAGLNKIPAIEVNPKDDISSLTIALVENVQRTDLNAIELARAYFRLHDEFGRTQEEIAKTVGKSRPHVANTLRLLELDEEIMTAIGEGAISAGHAKALLMAPPAVRPLLFERITKRSLSVRDTEKAAKNLSRIEKAPVVEQAPEVPDNEIVRMLKEMEYSLESALKRKVKIERGVKGSGRLTMEFYSDSDLEALIERIKRDN